MTMLASMGVSIMLRSNLVQYVCNNFLTLTVLGKLGWPAKLPTG